MERREPGKLEALLALVSTAIMAWYLIPPGDRQMIRIRAVHGLHRLAARLAYRTGHKGMGDELSQRDLQRYQVAYWLSLARDELSRVLEAMKP